MKDIFLALSNRILKFSVLKVEECRFVRFFIEFFFYYKTDEFLEMFQIFMHATFLIFVVHIRLIRNYMHYIHNWSLQPCSHDYDQASHTTYVVCVNFIHEW